MESNGDNLSVRVASFSYYLDTAKESLVQRISAQDPPFLLSPGKTMSNSTKPLINSNSKEDQDIKNLRVDSLSYLNKAGENLVFKVPNKPINDPTNAFSFSHQNLPKDNNELSVFGADKYFKMKLEYDNKKPARLNPTLPGIEARTPSLCSEATSMNSQTALLQRNGSLTRQRKTLARKIFTGFGCQPHCFDRKDVHVNHIVAPVCQMGSRRINPHASMVVVPSSREISTIIEPMKTDDHHFRKPAEKVLEEPRHSIEVFGSNTKIKDNLAKNMEMKLSMLTWDAIPKTGQVQFPTSSSTICDDMASDASSDLFEIEHLSASLPSLSKLDATDDMSSCMSPQSHYAPSEASIQWSVVTATAPDYSSVLYEHDDESASVAGDRAFAMNKSLGNKNAKTRNGGAKETQKSPRVGLLGCKSLKAVNVAENVSQKGYEKAKKQEMDSSVTFVKSQSIRGRVQQQDIIGTRDLPTTFVNDGD